MTKHSHLAALLQAVKAALLLLCIFSALLPVSATAAPQSYDKELDDHWSLVSDRDGIKVYMRHRDDSRLKTFRGIVTIDYADEYVAPAVLEDYDKYPSWLHFVDNALEISRNNPMDRLMHFTTFLPWPLKDREAVLHADVKTILTPEEESVTVLLTNQPDAIPPNDKYIRFPEMEGMLKATRLPGNKAEIIYQLVLDPGGYIPSWLANVLLRDAPYYTLLRLRRAITKPEYLNQYFDYVELRGPARPDNLAPARSYIYDNPPAQAWPDGLPLEMQNAISMEQWLKQKQIAETTGEVPDTAQ